MSNILDKNLEQRRDRIRTALGYLDRTRMLFEKFGSAELKTSHARFEELRSALESDSVRLVVLGEFSRGKSSLVNALLGIHLLPTALQATTAINTFVRSLPPGRTERFIRVHYQDGRPSEEVAWADDTALERWGTELDAGHADVRKTIDYIEAFMDHPLLAKGLVLVDTPGMQSVMEHHEQITRRAIAEAHIALWVQNTTQLGGSASEWCFLSDTLRTSFRKFITVIGWWDYVLEPEDAHERRKPLDVRVLEKLDVVRQNFQRHLGDSEEVQLLTDADHLIPVSAKWALSANEDRRKFSGIDTLATRIAALFTNGEALEQIYAKPLQQLSHIQLQLADSLQDETRQLDTDKTLAERARDIEMLDHDIKALRLEADSVARTSSEEHERVAKVMVEKLLCELVAPLAELKAEIEYQVNEQFVRRQIEKKIKSIGLPAELDAEFKSVSKRVGEAWKRQSRELVRALEGLRQDYARQMDKHAGALRDGLQALDLSIPALDISIDLDFSDIEQHHRLVMELELEIDRKRDEIESLQSEAAGCLPNQVQIDMARQAVMRAERMIEQLGPQPTPTTRYRREVVKRGGTWSSDEYGDVAYADRSSAEAWSAEMERQRQNLQGKEQRLQEIMAEEERKTGILISEQRALKKYERELADFEKKKARLLKQAQEAQSDMVQGTARRLVRGTAGQLEQRIRYLQNEVADGIHKLFMDQLEALQACVKEQCLEPLNAKLAKREEVQALLQCSQAEIHQRRAELEQGRRDVAELMAQTQAALQA